MADVTVEQLAEVVGAPVQRLLQQMHDAGLHHKTGKEIVSDEEKSALLAYLRSKGNSVVTGLNGQDPITSSKITLKRKTISKMKVPGSTGKGKVVNVEVRKKRTFVKETLAADIQEEKKKQPVATTDTAEQDLKNVEELAHKQAKLEQERIEAERNRKAEEQRKKEEAQHRKEAEEARRKRQELLNEQRDERTNKKWRRAAPSKDSVDPPRKRGKRKGKGNQVAPENDFLGYGSKRAAPSKALKSKTLEHGFTKPSSPVVREVLLPEALTVGELAQKMAVKGAEVVKLLFKLGTMATINQMIDQETAAILVEELGHKPKLLRSDAIETALLEESQTIAKNIDVELKPRAPVVTVMGHVDHGKTSLLDYVRKTCVQSGEAGGITQHIGAYHVNTQEGMITFLDTPGHSAFTAMRARGAQVTDIVVLVVAADDGVMPQTEEAIQHAKAADVPVIVAINKIDKENTDIDRIKNELAQRDIICEEWGGENQFVEVSALTGKGMDYLLNAILVQAELLELQAAYVGPAKGVVIESRLDKGRGSVASILVQNGTLKKGDNVLVGQQFGRIRAMYDENGVSIQEAGPSIPVEILGLDGTPEAGDGFQVVQDEKKAREVALFRQGRFRDVKLAKQQASKMENAFKDMASSSTLKVLKIVLKTDVRGSLEAIITALRELTNDEVSVEIISSGVGGITETDANLAVASDNAIVIGFNVRSDASAKKILENENISLRYYSVIYDIIDDVKLALTGMLDATFREEIVGVAEVRDVFKSPKLGAIAGCMVLDGTIFRSERIRVLRDNIVIYEGELESLRRFKDDVSEVRAGTECGIGVKGYNDVAIGDKIEVYKAVKVNRVLMPATKS